VITISGPFDMAMLMRSKNVSSVVYFGVSSLVLMLAAFPVRAGDLVVSTTSDVINGDISNPSALKANPGPDGISLREAIEAVNKAPGPHTIVISPSLEGQTLQLSAALPHFKRDGITLQRLYDVADQPSFTVDAANAIAVEPGAGVISVRCSDFKISGFRIVRIMNFRDAVNVKAVSTNSTGLPTEIKNVCIEGNAFDNTGLQNQTDVHVNAIVVETAKENSGNSVMNVIVRDNVINGFYVGITTGSGDSTRFDNLVIHGNTFINNELPMELVPEGTGSRLKGTRITANTFTQNGPHLAITFGFSLAGSGSMIDELIIAGNEFRDESIAIHLALVGAMNMIRNTIIANNLTHGTFTIRCEGAQNTVGNTLIVGNRHLGSDVFVNI